MTAQRVMEAAALYPDRNDLFRNYPELKLEDLQKALDFAAVNLEDSATGQAPLDGKHRIAPELTYR